jgi:hypothetical protein
MLKNNHILRVILLTISCMAACSGINIFQKDVMVKDSVLVKLPI